MRHRTDIGSLKRAWKISARSGLTLLEIMLVCVLAASLVLLGAWGLGLMDRSNAQREALKFSGVVRFVYNEAATNNTTFQLVIDLDNNTYWVDKLEVSGGLTREELAGTTLKSFDSEEDAGSSRSDRLDEEDTEFTDVLARTPLQGPLIEDTVLPEPIAFLGVMTSHHECCEPQSEGIATINFFPNGFVERAVIYIGEDESKIDGEDPAIYTLLINPLTGHSTLRLGKIEIDDQFFDPEED